MLFDIFNVPVVISINGKEYKAEYDFKGYAMLETLTGKGFYKLHNLLMVQNNISLSDSIEIVCCSLLKHHTVEDIAKVRENLQSNLHAIKELNNEVISAFVAPMIPPEITAEIKELKKKMTEEQKKTKT